MLDLSQIQNLSTREAMLRLEAKKRITFARALIEPHIKQAAGDADAIGLLPNHIFTLASYSLVQLKVKSRKIADSWGLTLYALAQAATNPGSQVNIGSYDEEEAKNKLRYLDSIYDVLPRGERRELRMSDGSEKRKFSNQSEINFLTRKAPTGASGDYLGDEFSVEPKGRVTATEILTAALGGLTHKGSLRLTGTQRGEDTLFYKIYSGEWQREMLENPIFELLPQVEWEVGEFPWWESPALCVDPVQAAIEAPHLDTPDRVVKFGNAKLQQQFVIYLTTPGLGLPIFQREFELKVVADGDQYFTLEELTACYPQKGAPYWFRHIEIDGARFNHDPSVVRPALDIIDALDRVIKAGQLRGEFGYGYDVGRTHDLDEIVIGHNLPEDRYSLCVRAVISLKNMPFGGKRKILEYLLQKTFIKKGQIDATRGGLGHNLGEDFELKYRERARAVQFTNANKQMWATAMKARISQRKWLMPYTPRPDSPDFSLPETFTKLQTQLLALKKTESAAGNIMFEVARNADGHGDCFWAGALFNDLYPPMPEQHGQSVIVVGRNGKQVIGAGNRPRYGSEVNGSRVIRPNGYNLPQRKVIR